MKNCLPLVSSECVAALHVTLSLVFDPVIICICLTPLSYFQLIKLLLNF